MSILDFETGIASAISGTPSAPIGTTTAARIGTYALEGIAPINTQNFSLTCNSKTDLWISFIVNYDNFQAGYELLKLYDNLNAEYLRIVASSTTGIWYIQLYDDASWNTIGTSQFYSSDVTRKWDIHIVISDTIGQVQLHVDSILDIDFSGDTILGSQTNISTVTFISNTQFYYTYFSSMFIADEDTRTITMVQHTLTGNGTYETDMGGGYDGIDTLGAIDDTNPVLCSAIGNTQSYTKSAVPAAFSTYSVVAVGTTTRASSPSGSSITGLAGITTDGTYLDEGTTNSLNSIPGPQRSIFPLAPDGGAWTIAKVDAAEIGFRGKG